MDAFAVSVCKGLAIKSNGMRESLICGFYFGLFQALMPLIGFFLGSSVEKYINRFAPWIAFILLSIIGISMIIESRSEMDEVDPGLDVKTMLVLAVATSIDALAVGITIAVIPINIMEGSVLLNTIVGVCIIGITTAIISFLGVRLGHKIGARCRSHAELLGGVTLTIIGLKILIENVFM